MLLLAVALGPGARIAVLAAELSLAARDQPLSDASVNCYVRALRVRLLEGHRGRNGSGDNGGDGGEGDQQERK